jgi:scyllo-inositol 2-dehydrogenase (NADP+)
MNSIQTAILSFGMSGRVFHAPFIHNHSGFTIRGIWERTKSESINHYPNIHIYRSLEEVLSDDTIDLVIVNTPTNTHFEFTKKALEANKHVVVEKAFTTTVEEAVTLNELAKQKNLFLSIYQNRRWDSELLTIKQVMASGKLGGIVEAELHFDRYKPELGIKAHKEEPGPGAGLLNDLGPHLIDQALHLFGNPTSVFADIRTIRSGSLVDDYFAITLFYDTKRVILKSSMMVKEPLPSFVIHGTKGSFIKKRADPQEALLLKDIPPTSTHWGAEQEADYGELVYEEDGITHRNIITSEKGNYGAYYEAVFQSITHQQPITVPATEAIVTMQIIEAAIKSSNSQALIHL